MSTRSVRRVVAVFTAAVTCGVLFPAAAAVAAPVAAPAAPAVPGDLVPVVTRQSLLGTHTWYRQTFHGLPVLDSFYAVHTNADGSRVVDDGRLAVPATLDTTAAVAADGAVRSATAAVASAAGVQAKTTRPAKDVVAVPAPGDTRGTLAVVGGARPALVWSVVSTSDDGESETRVDAHTGAVLSVRSLSKNADGTGQVFDPNPVVKLENQDLVDGNDRNTSVPRSAYVSTPLAHLTAGSTLSGRYARIVKASVAVATSSTRTYSYLRADDRFEQVNAYHGVDTTQTYIQSLGFTDVNNEAQKLKIDTTKVDNSFYSPGADTITYGTGGVDDAEDLEVVWHEYGHAIQDAQVPSFGSSAQAGAIGEGFGDYWAVTMSRSTSAGYDLPCVMDWDSTAYTVGAPHCLRRTDTGKTTADIDGEVHDDGEIWSNALWDIQKAIGQTKADTAILEAQFTYAPNTSFAAAANKTVAAVNTLYGADAASKARASFVARKILK